MSIKNCHIRQFETGTFNGLTSLNYLKFNGNQINFRKIKAFTELKNLTKLDLRQCYFNLYRGHKTQNLLQERTIKTNSYIGFHRVEEINFHNSQIMSIETGAFNNLESLKRLNLSDNPIIQLNAKILLD